MSEGIVRKVQPFTIGTRLSIPAVPKCPDFPTGYLPAPGLDNCTLQHNLNHDSVSLYLSRSHVCTRGPCLRAPLARQVAPVRRRQENMQVAEDHLNQNTVSASAVSRSIRKITISGSGDDAGRDKVQGEERDAPSIVVSPSENHNNNNNNITAGSHPRPPRIVGVSCENNASSHFQVLLRKDGDDKPPPGKGQTKLTLDREKTVQQTSVARGQSPKTELQKRDSPPHTPIDGSKAVPAQTDCFTQRTSLFTKEILQAEAWIRGKLQDLKDGCNIQRCPLQDWEEASQTLLRDLKHFENTHIQLNQMGEQLICKLNPTSDLVRKQLGQLRDQWQILKQTAANQSRALGGAKNLQEFNRKVDKLEAWIKQKEEEQSLVNVLGENADKMQLTRRILDLKQDEQLYRNLHEEINHLALKLEKQGKTDGKNITSRRKHINKMWLKVQSHLKNYHENLQLALEVSSFYQQADNTLFAMGSMAKGLPASKEQESCGDREIRDIASQIMMLDVTVSQLSNLHPALAAGVTQKQSEVKDCWALLQKTVRSDRAALQAAVSTFTREDVDLLTPSGEAQCTVGTEPPRILGKEVKEEQNRLKGCVITRESGSCKRTAGNPSQKQKSGSHGGALPLGESPAPVVDDVMVRHQSEGERKQRAEPKLATALQGHPQLHIQLQRFTVSADKTLSWLKKNVAMATQVCPMVGYEGLEAAKKCQDALEEEIISNRARIEVVKKEGRGLIRAQHPGSAKIEEFLGQLEVLWEELRRRHRRNSVFLQASEELGFRVVKVLQALGGLQAWLESVELSLRESSLAGDPETVSAAEKESRLLLREVAARGLELHALRQEVEKLRGQCHPHARSLPARMEEVERKYHRVQSALTQQSSELQDTRMLTEFLERVELEESQELTGGHYSLGQPFHGEITSTPTLLGLQSSGGGDPLMESMGDPVEELREAVEMLNDTVRERGRAQSHDQAVQELLSKHASLAVHVEEGLCCCKELSMDILERETDMATKCELDHCGLEGLQEQQDQLEVDHEGTRQQVEEMKAQASRLEELCPDKLRVLRVRIQATLQAWTELGEGLVENRRRLQEFVQLQDFFRSYLAMILWTEDTRSRIFSELTLHHGKEGEETLAAELDFQIEQKFEEFDELSTTGSNLLHAEHHLNKMVRERMEELRSMLGWILVHWRAQKQQWLLKRKREEPSQDNIYSEATVCLPLEEGSVHKPEDHNSHRSPAPSACEDAQSLATDTQALVTPARQAREPDEKRSEDWYEVMKSIGPHGGEDAPSESPKPPVLLLKEPGSPTRAGTVNLILSFGNTGDGPAQRLEPPLRMEEAAGETSEPIHRVSTYLHVKDNNMALTPVYESITLPRQKSCPASSVSSSLAPSSSSPPAPAAASQTASVSFHPMTRSGSSSVFSSLKRMGKKRKRKRDARRHTIQRIMGVEEYVEEEPRYTCETMTYSTHTWPLKEARKKKSSTKSLSGGEGGEYMAYMKNPLLRDIDTDCSGDYSITPYAVSEGPSAPPATSQVRSHCRFLSLGSVLSFDLPKDVSLIPSIQDIITIAPPESKTGGATHPDLCSQRPTSLSSFKQTRAQPASTQSPTLMGSTAGSPETQTHVTVSDADERPQGPSTPSQGGREEDQTVLCRDLCETRCSCFGVTSLQEDAEQEWEDMSSQVTSAETAGQASRSLEDSPLVQVHSTTRATQSHECLSVHTLIKDLHGHQYRRTARPLSPRGDSPGQSCTQSPGQAAQTVANLRSALNVTVRENSVDSGVSSSGSFKLCSDAACLDIPLPQGVVGRLMSLEVGGIDCTNARFNAHGFDPSPDSAEPETEPIHPDHQQFEEEEKELEDIWNHSNSYRRSICSDIMYQPHAEEVSMASHQPTEPSAASASPKPQAVLYRKLITASAPNLLVAELRLPASIQSALGYDKEQRSRDQPLPLAKGDRRSWAAFPHREQPCKASLVVNETASDRVKLPEIKDNRRYIYQYKAEEEEEDDREGEAKVGEPAGCSKDQSMSLLSVHMGLDGVCQRDTETQEQSMTTGGQHNPTSGKPELLAMEGTLERKHKLQLGGKKASSRAWNPYLVVLHRHTLCFYHDRKDTLRSSVCGLPLDLHGAECSPAPEYTKKPNCFRLRLRDGSEYLLNASSRFLMKKWILRIQANTGLSEGSPSASDVPVIQDLTVSSSSCGNQTLHCSCQGLAKCRCSSPHNVVSTFPRRKSTSSAQAKEIVVLTRDYTSHSLSKSLDEPHHVSSSKTGGGDDFLRWTPNQRLSAGYRDSRSFSPQSYESCGQEWPVNKRRSHSFTSATYQKIKPVKAPPGGREQEGSSNYSVTLVIGDKSSNMTWQQDAHQDSTLRSYGSMPRPRNKSVFKKFFGRKDGHI